MSIGPRICANRTDRVVVPQALFSSLLPPLLTVLGTGVGFVLYILLSIVGLVLISFCVIWFFGFVWWFIKPHFRAWHINHIRNNRLLKEAANRGEVEDQ